MHPCLTNGSIYVVKLGRFPEQRCFDLDIACRPQVLVELVLAHRDYASVHVCYRKAIMAAGGVATDRMRHVGLGIRVPEPPVFVWSRGCEVDAGCRTAVEKLHDLRIFAR